MFADYNQQKTTTGKNPQGGSKASTSSGKSTTGQPSSTSGPKAKPGALFNYDASLNSGLLKQLMKEAKEIKCSKLPAAATFLLRNIVEGILRHIIEEQSANQTGKSLDLEGCLNLCISNHVTIPSTYKKILIEFKKDHLSFLNLGSHGNIIPNETRLFQARDTIDQFVKKYV